MMEVDVNEISQLYESAVEQKYSAMKDERLERDPQADLHSGIDIAYEFAKKIKGLHPLAEKQIKAMIFQGSLL